MKKLSILLMLFAVMANGAEIFRQSEKTDEVKLDKSQAVGDERAPVIRIVSPIADSSKLELSQWTFSQAEGVEPINNQAERALRRAVIWRRKSFGTQSEAGSRFVERFLTVMTTLRQRGRSVFDYLCRVCRKPRAAQTITELTLA